MLQDNMDSTLIAMEERVKIEDKVASAILNAASSNGPAPAESPRADDAQQVSSDAEVRFPIFCG
jgi:hypothetical protein